MSTSQTRELVTDLVGHVPELSGLLHEHQRDHSELLPHIFVADVARWVAERFSKGIGTDGALVSKTLDFLEERYLRGPEEVSELIAVSFVEMLPSTGDPASGIRELLGPNLREQFRRLNW